MIIFLKEDIWRKTIICQADYESTLLKYISTLRKNFLIQSKLRVIHSKNAKEMRKVWEHYIVPFQTNLECRFELKMVGLPVC